MNVVRPRLLLILATAALLAEPAAGQSAGTGAAGAPTRVLQAERVAEPVVVDGRLDEPAWLQATPAKGFRQFEPAEGASATHRTEVRILYDDHSLYVAARLLDEDPSAIEAALGRRDDYNRADWFLVAVDSYQDLKTAYVFGVNAAGVQYDGLRTGEGRGPAGVDGVDESWDAIWYSDVQVDAHGWTAELRIPYSMLRFSEAGVQSWGIHFTRRIPRMGEVSEWPLVPRTERANLVAQYGTLTGIAGVEPRRNLQVRPYAVSRLHTSERSGVPGQLIVDPGVDVGGDVRLSLGSNASLDATINPDFGQVESDPAVLNLTAFETFFQERRPFFLEGSQIFQFEVGPGQLLYTRRIGAETPIIGAAKVSGRTESGLSFGLLGAATGDRFSPGRYYGVARGSQQVGDFSSIGGIATGFYARTPGHPQRGSSSGGADWDLRFAGNRYGMEGFAAVTHRNGEALDAESGFAGKTWLRRREGSIKGFVGVDLFSKHFDPNEVGQLRLSNFVAALTSVDYDLHGGQAFGPFQRASIEGFAIQQIAYDTGLNRGLSIDVGSRWTLRGFQQAELDLSVAHPFGGYDVYETRGLGPRARPMTIAVRGEFDTDERRSWSVEPGVVVAFDEDGGRTLGADMRGSWSVSSRFSLSGDVEAEWEDGLTAWTANELFRRTSEGWMIGRRAGVPDATGDDAFVAFDDGGKLDVVLEDVVPLVPGQYYVPVFGARDTRSLDLTIRGTVTFIRNLSLQLYSQLFLARGRYADFQILQDQDTLVPFDRYPKRDEFAFSRLQSNMVLRWEYRPGATLYVVWTHGRRADDILNPLAPWGDTPYESPLRDQLSETFRVFPENVFLIKLDYTFLR